MSDWWKTWAYTCVGICVGVLVAAWVLGSKSCPPPTIDHRLQPMVLKAGEQRKYEEIMHKGLIPIVDPETGRVVGSEPPPLP